MKIFDLQMFADAENSQSAPAEEKPKAAEKPASETAQAQPKKQAEARYTDADVDRIIDRKFAEWQKKQQEAVDEAKRLAEMSATERAEHERDQLQKQLDELRRKDSLAEMTRTARKMLADSGVTVPDEVVSMIVNENADQTKSAVEGFTAAFNAAVEAAVKERLRGEPPRKGAGAPATMTKAEIMAIRDPELRQRKMLENRALFNI